MHNWGSKAGHSMAYKLTVKMTGGVRITPTPCWQYFPKSQIIALHKAQKHQRGPTQGNGTTTVHSHCCSTPTP
jgi:hypothetical protein